MRKALSADDEAAILEAYTELDSPVAFTDVSNLYHYLKNEKKLKNVTRKNLEEFLRGHSDTFNLFRTPKSRKFKRSSYVPWGVNSTCALDLFQMSNTSWR